MLLKLKNKTKQPCVNLHYTNTVNPWFEGLIRATVIKYLRIEEILSQYRKYKKDHKVAN